MKSMLVLVCLLFPVAVHAQDKLAGEKLDWVERWAKSDYTFYGKGGVALDGAGLASAGVVFLLSNESQHRWKLVRYVFSGNKMVGRTEQGFRTRPGPSKFR